MYIDAHRLDDSLFLDPYVELMTDRLDCPPQFHPLVATVAVSSCLNRELGVFFDQSDFFPNVLGLIVSESGTRKSTAMRPLVSMANLRILPEEVYLMPYDVTPERFVDILAEHPQALFLNDEFGHFLSRSSSRRQSYMTGFLQMMTHITDCPPRHSRSLVGREVVVEKPYLTALLGLTPEVLISTSSLLDVLQGFLPRFLIVTGSLEDMARKPLKIRDKHSEEVQKGLRDSLRIIYDTYKNFSFNYLPITEEALEALNKYGETVWKRMKSDIPEMRRFHERWAYQILKLAVIRMADHLGRIVTKEDIVWAIKEYERYLEGARKVVEGFIAEEISDKGLKRIKDYIVSECKKRGQIPTTEVLRKFNIRSDYLCKIISTLEMEGLVEREVCPNPRGKPTTLLRLSKSEE